MSALAGGRSQFHGSTIPDLGRTGTGSRLTRLRAVLADLAPLDVEAQIAPRLPALERFLARATSRPAPADWRAFAAAAFGVAEPAALPVASLLATAAGLPPSPRWYVATPLHLVAGMNHVRVHAAGPVTLDAERAQRLVARHGEEFAGDGTELVATRFGLLFRAPADLAPTVTHDPERSTGRDVAPILPSGAGGRRLRALMAERDMWLHAQAAAGPSALAPNTLWLWGASEAPLPAPSQRPAVAGNEPFLAALSVLLPATAPPVRSELRVLRVASLGADGNAFAAADETLFAPLLAAARRGEFERVELWYAGRVYSLGRLGSYRPFRRERPWWQEAGS